MFIENKYYRWYMALTAKADEGVYTENHHRIPKSMGGGEGDNLVRLSFRKHFLAHWLLTKCTEGGDKHKMLLALRYFQWGSHRVLSGWQYEVLRRAMVNGKVYSVNGKKAIELGFGIRKGDKFTEQHKKNLSKSHTGLRFTNSDETCSKKSVASYLREARKRELGTNRHTPETCAKISNALKRRPRRKQTPEEVEANRIRGLGRKASEETRKKMSLAHSGKCRITDGYSNKRIPLRKIRLIPKGWRRGYSRRTQES